MDIITEFISTIEQRKSPVQIPVISRTVTVPPPTPSEGDRYIIPVGATGVWSPYPNYVAEVVPDATGTLVWLVYEFPDSGIVYVEDEGVYLEKPEGLSFIEFIPGKHEKQVSIPDNDTTDIIIGNATTCRALQIHYTLEYSTTYTTGVLLVASDGSDVAVDDERLIFESAKCLNGISFTGDINSGNIRLNVVASSVGGTSKFRYTLKLISVMS